MKTIKTALIYYALISCATVHTMELVPLISSQKNKPFQINTLQDIPKLSLKDIRPCFNILPEKKQYSLLATQNKNGVLLSQFRTFNLALLEEKDIKLQILTCMLDGDKQSAEIFYNIPLWYAYKKYDEARKMIKKSSLKINQPIGLLFRLSAEQQKEIMNIVTKSFTSKIINARIIIDEDQYEKIQLYEKEIQENFFAEEDIAVITDDIKYERDSKQASTILVGVTMGATIAFIETTIVSLYLFDRNNCSYANNTTYICPENPLTIAPFILVPPFFGGILSWLIGKIYYAQSAGQKAQKIEI